MSIGKVVFQTQSDVIPSDEPIIDSRKVAGGRWDSNDLGSGAIILTSSRIVWIPTDTNRKALSIDLNSLILHAVTSPDPNKKLYLQVHVTRELMAKENDDDDDDEDGEEKFSEFNFDFADQSELSQIFSHITEVLAAIPNPEAEEEADGELFTAEDFSDDGP